VLHWNGSAWSRQSSPNGSNGGALDGVACPSATHCVAVGGGGAQRGLVLVSSGASWAVQPSATTSSEATLTGIACTSTAACVADGFVDSVGAAPTEAPLIERYG
jgi:hypothetical protein